MQKFIDYKNVFIDQASEYSLVEVNERNYLISLFKLLKELLNEEFYTYHFYLLFSRFIETQPASIYSKHPKKVLFWFGEESGELPFDFCDSYQLVFKSYVIKEARNIYSTPLGFINEFEENLQSKQRVKDIRFFFAGNLNHHRRELYEFFFFRKYPFLKFLRRFSFSVPGLFFFRLNIHDLSSHRKKTVALFSKGFKSGLQFKDYIEMLDRSQFVICPKGFYSTETYRHAEALSRDCIVVSEEMPQVSIYQENPFLVYRNINELQDIIEKISSGFFNEKLLVERHISYYRSNLEIQAIAKRIARLCHASS